MTLRPENTEAPEQESLALASGENGKLHTPTHWHKSYSEAERASVTYVVSWLNQHTKTQAWIGRLARVNSGTLNQVLKGAYPSSPAKFVAQLVEACKLYDERRGKRGVPFVETSVVKLAKSVCHRARLYRNFGMLTGYVGTGKTEALKHIAEHTPSTFLVEADPDMGPGALLDALVRATKAEVNGRGKYSQGSTAEKFGALVRALGHTDALIIVDEAETLQPRSLHYLRRMRDKAHIGVVLSGTEYLNGLIQPEHGQFDQIRSRVGFWPKTVSAITREDADAIAQGAFDDIELTQAVLDALWAYGSGSIRVLAEDLIPLLRDFGLNRGRILDAVFVKQVATEALGLKPRKEAA